MLALLSMFGAGNEARTRDLNLGKVALYQLSYSRISSLELYIDPKAFQSSAKFIDAFMQ
jgi:hypothetical protein